MLTTVGGPFVTYFDLCRAFAFIRALLFLLWVSLGQDFSFAVSSCEEMSSISLKSTWLALDGGWTIQSKYLTLLSLEIKVGCKNVKDTSDFCNPLWRESSLSIVNIYKKQEQVAGLLAMPQFFFSEKHHHI